MRVHEKRLWFARPTTRDMDTGGVGATAARTRVEGHTPGGDRHMYRWKPKVKLDMGRKGRGNVERWA